MQGKVVEPFEPFFKQVRIVFFVLFDDKNLRRRQWTVEEDICLLVESLRAENKWSVVAKKLVGRTQHAVKNRYICILGRNLQISKENIRDSIKKKEAWKLALASLEVLKCEKIT